MPNKATFELDHLFICTDVGAPAAACLGRLGLVEGPANRHPGQGTENRRFFFHNSMLELLWVYSAEEARSEPIRRTHLWERWQQRHDLAVCPFGLCLRPVSSSATSPPSSPLFSAWDFCPPYLPSGLSIAVGNNSNLLSEPMLFQTPFSKRPDQQPLERSLPITHPLGLKELTGVVLSMPNIQRLSSELEVALRAAQIELREEDYCITLIFDDESQNQRADLRPDLPLVVCW